MYAYAYAYILIATTLYSHSKKNKINKIDNISTNIMISSRGNSYYI